MIYILPRINIHLRITSQLSNNLYALSIVARGSMPTSCSFGLCRNTQSNSTCRFFRFPTSERDPDRRKLWAVRCGRKTADGRLWEPNPNTKSVSVCSAHFISGKQCDLHIESLYRSVL